MTTAVNYRHGTSPDALSDLADGSVDAVITDPPYGTEAYGEGYGRRQLHGNGVQGRTISGDRDLSQIERCLPTILRICQDDAWVMLWCAARTRASLDRLCIDAGLTTFGELVWDKGAPGLGYSIRYAHETLAIYSKGEPKKFSDPLLSVHRAPVDRSNVYAQHPHSKPVSILRVAIRWATPNGGLVVDPFAGTGPIAVAAIIEGRRYIGVECDSQWWAKAQKRIAGARYEKHPEEAQGELLSGDAA